jgi:hypothetical protein
MIELWILAIFILAILFTRTLKLSFRKLEEILKIENFSSNPRYVVFFRHCDKEKNVCDDKNAFPTCCMTKNVPPFSCDDCSVRGYARSYNLPSAMKKLLGEKQLTSIYAAGSKEMNKNCSHSRRMWEMVIPLATANILPINTTWCVDQLKDTAKDIIENNQDGIVAVSWEHNALPELVGWVSALSKNPKSKNPDVITVNGKPLKWPGSDVFDQFWILDLTSGTPKFYTATQ